MSLFNKTLMYALLCLAFIGQSTAAPLMSYEMDSVVKSHDNQHQHSVSMTVCSQPEHIAPASSIVTCVMADDCCTTECLCLVSGCSSNFTFAYSKELGTDITINLPSKITTNSFLIPPQILSSFYRPPIVS